MNTETTSNSKARLIETAEQLFAENGFEGTSIRDLTAKAGCNVAAVNYHFGSKDDLYREVFLHRMNSLRHSRIKAIENVMSQNHADITLEDLLIAFTRSFVEPLLQENTGPRFMKLMTREMIDPRLPASLFLEKMIIPILTIFKQSLMKIYPSLNAKNAELAIRSVVAQLLHTIHTQKIFASKETSGLEVINLEEILQHIVTFSAAGIRAYAKGDT